MGFSIIVLLTKYSASKSSGIMPEEHILL